MPCARSHHCVAVPLSRSKTKVGKGKKIRTLFQPEWPTDTTEIPDIKKYPSAFASLSEEVRWDPSRCSAKTKGNEGMTYYIIRISASFTKFTSSLGYSGNLDSICAPSSSHPRAWK